MNEYMRRALEYIEAHLNEPISYETAAEHVHLSPHYFHRLFTLISGTSAAQYIRERRVLRACALIASTDCPLIDIALECGFNSAQSFSRAFRMAVGMPPGEYRRRGLAPETITVSDMALKFNNRLRGGVTLNPKIIRRGALKIAGVSGDGERTWQVWNSFEKLCEEHPLDGKPPECGYEVRIYRDGKSTVHVGYAASAAPEPYEMIELPASQYAAFDVYVAKGYTSENDAMDQWLRTNEQGYCERLLGDAHYCVECYDERFCGEEAGSIVQIWVPIEKK